MNDNGNHGDYEVFVSKDYFKFNAAHFIAYPGFRERLHGHNYRVAVRLRGDLGPEGYVVDFGDIKRATRAVCALMDERVLIPMNSKSLEIRVESGQVELTCEDGSRFSFPEADCVLLPIAHSSAEELAAYIAAGLRESMDVLPARPLLCLEVTVAEAPNQEARFRMDL